ncbi:DUF3558 domain-containing protein [Streptomyces sp. GC420]|uniref:DUF3558 domain-containing protein n=1 Tax=Streptomyces sp. GC420 TaxID=2697568 RepID=UPI0014151228|nr:DUF3558 domain-containing protein [Streptomyces sp. GC420]NBM19435.1 DUF3558 domain-containing protein [Streptomyces sp. GC420]
MHLTAQRLARLLACAAVPVMLVAGCSSDSGSDSGKSKKGSGGSSSASPSATKASPSLAPAVYDTLPDACKTLAKKTVTGLVPGAEDKTGKAGKSSDVRTRAGCTWNGLDDNGLKGSQYRWLDVSLIRFDSDAALGGSGEERATDHFAKQVTAAQTTEGAKKVKSVAAEGIGDEATAVRYELRKTDEDFRNQTVVVRTENVVLTLNYNGAGYAGAKTPDPDELMKDAQKAAKEVVAAIATANE